MDLTATDLSESDLAIRTMVRSLVDREIAPVAAAIDREGRFPAEALKALAAVDLLGLLVPEEYGGAGGSMWQYVLVVEEIARGCASTAATYMTQAHCAVPIMLAGDQEQKERWLPALARGEAIGAIALTEPEAGSDLASLTTRARGIRDGYVLNGTKMFITNGGHADVICVLARTGGTAAKRPLTFLLVDGKSAGLTRGTPLKKMGIRASETVELSFDNVRVAEGDRLGQEGEGWGIAMRTLDTARLSTAAQALGIAQGAYEHALRYARERRQFGKAIYDFQAVMFRLVDMAIQIESARALLHRVARAVDQGSPGPLSGASAMVKVLCSDTAMKVTTDAVQTLGGYGFIEENQVERFMRDAKITQIYDGTNDINRLVVGRGL
jgi:alkylation response protein AidB-like acyl-CoA dehydrogenase